jgi:DNA-directed RNA polymerase subunit RPC12/RpoP
MQTVNFQCGHCGKLMAVTTQMLGRQVRCPHCQQVVLAPAPTPAPPSSVLEGATLSVTEEHDSIFTPPAEATEDLFGDAPVPRLELPPTQPSTFAPPPVPAPLPEFPVPEPTVTYDGPPATRAVPVPLVPPTVAGPDAPLSGAWSPAADTSPAPSSEIAPEIPTSTLVRRRPSQSGGWLMAVLIVPLISYSIATTILLALVYLNRAPDPLERMPDPGDPENHAKKQKQAVNFPPDWPRRDLPSNLLVELGHTLPVGQLEVTPKKVELAKITWHTPGQREGDLSRYPTLILHLEFKNVSDDVVFRPLDRYFDRKVDQERWQEKKDMPFTCLVMGKTRLWGGAIEWPGQKRFRIAGQDYDRELKPGESMETFTCLDPDTQDPDYLKDHPEYDVARYKGPLLYRVHVRRGLFPFRGRDVSTTAVIGVEFTDKDIQRSG